MNKIELRYYQREAVDAVFKYFQHNTGNPLVVLPTGAGKSLTMAAFIHEAINMYPATRILLLTHVKELIEQDAKAIINYWPEAPVGIWSASVGQKQKQQITVAGIQSIHKWPAKFSDTDLIIVDECFTGETLVSTPYGNKRIDGIKCGDLVHNALGSGIVEAISEKTSLSILKIGFNDGTFIRCTKNHPIFTTKGWVKAGCLEIGTSVFSSGDLLKLRETILPLDQEDGFRRNYKCSKREYLEKAKVLLNILLEEAQQPNARYFGQNENARNAKTHTTPTDKAGREWASTSSSTTSITSCAWGGMDSRICGTNKKTPWNWVSNLLQIGHCKSIYKNWNRDRWPKSWVNGKNGTGQEEGSFIGRIRVESIEVEQPESNESVFNLRVSGHPSYFANGILVHNCHLVPRSGGTMYRKFLDSLLKYNDAIKVIGLTATEYRTDSGLLVEGEDRVFTDVAYSANVGTLIKEGYLCPLVMKGGATKADLSNLHVRGGEYIPGEAQKAMDHAHLIEGALDEVAQFAADRKHILGFCAGVEHAYHCMQKARERGWTADYVHGAMTSTQRDYIINSFKQGKIRFLFNANILTTGFDAPLVDCIIMLRPTKSTGLYCLDEKTEILTSQGWKGIGKVNAGDCVPSLNMNTGKGQWAGVLSSIERETYADESFVSYIAPRADFRVTDNHNMLFCTTNEWEPHAPQYRLDTAANMASFADGVRVPTAVEIDQPGVPLTDAEIYFIGMMLTDGTWNAFQAGISQSERHPEIIERIEKCLTDCGFLWKKRKVKTKTQFNECYPRWIYSISAGKPKNGVDGSGFRHLMPYLDKDFAQSLLSLSRRQFVVLMKAIHDGDGFKVEKSPDCDWTPRSWTICSARKTFMDRLQALAAIHGFTGNLRHEQGKSRKNPIYILTVTPQAWRSIGGSGKRPQMTTSPAGKERVWCVETETGTIITRRNGKVTVMGNCQIMGRGLRKHKDKENTLVLDFVGAVATHGPIDAIVVKSKRKKGEATIGVAPVKECPKCNELIHASVMLCPGCGHEFPASAVHGTEAADGVIVAALAKPQRYEVDTVNYSLHMKENRRSLKVEYWCGLKTFTEFLPVEDERSFVRKHAVAYFWKRGCTCPNTVDEALAMNREGRIPRTKSIIAKLEGKYWRVIDAEIDFEKVEVAV